MSALAQPGGAITERAENPSEVRSETAPMVSVDRLCKRYGETTLPS
jgi:hypothetical protein